MGGVQLDYKALYGVNEKDSVIKKYDQTNRYLSFYCLVDIA
jgi:hypothetical protein